MDKPTNQAHQVGPTKQEPFPIEGDGRCAFSWGTLGKLTLAKVTSRLEDFGTVLSEDHRFALRALVRQMIKQAKGERRGRYGAPLPMGGGKTLASECFAWALHELAAPFGIVIAVNRLRDMEAMHKDLVAMGVDPADIGVLHSETDQSKISIGTTDSNGSRRIMLVTHSRLQGGDAKLPEYAFYKCEPRALVIYDESLVSTDSWTLPVDHLVEVVRGVQGRAEDLYGYRSDDEEVAFDYLGKVKDLIMAEVRRQEDEDDPEGRRVSFPPLPQGTTKADLVAAIEPKHRRTMGSVIANAGGGARALMVERRNGVVWYDVTVPDALDNMLVLDASLVVRLLPKLGGSIRPVPGFPERVISYENVTLYHLKKGMARKSTDDVFRDHRRLNGYTREIAKVIKSLPADEGVNLILYKDDPTKGRQYSRKLENSLGRAGVDLGEVMPCGRPRFNLITWGNETATNAYSYAPHTIFVSVLHRDHMDLASDVVAAKRDLRARRVRESLDMVMASEVAHGIAQAAGRSAIRRANDGKAGRGTIWLPMRTTGVLDLLKEHALPGIIEGEWAPTEDDWRTPGGPAQWKVIANAIEGVLKTRTEDVSSAQLKKEIEAQGIKCSRRPWETAQARLANDPPADWMKVAQSWKYTPQRFDDLEKGADK